MIANFFHNLSDHGVESLLISGQATVLYGAATFSEDIDLWINPTADNRVRFLAVLRACKARYYKLTPPFEVDYLRRGHGFHFILPAGNEPEVFLDVMGQPPRVDSFDTTRSTGNWIETDWGRVLTIGVKPLIELKKTQRLEDYPIIGRLALAWLDQPGRAAAATDYPWAVDNIFTLAELRRLFEKHPAATSALPAAAPGCLREFARHVRRGSEPLEPIETEVSIWMQERMVRLQQADRGYWRGIIRELRQLRASGQLMPEGSVV
jgi:hypothetical protein